MARRKRAAARYRPEQIRLLLVAEAPPAKLDRYFYFTDVTTHDSLFRYVCKGLFGCTPARDAKSEYLNRLCKMGVFLIDLSPEPIVNDARPRIATALVHDLIERCRALNPKSILLINKNVHKLALSDMQKAGLPVVDVAIPFPGSGQQRNFEQAFAKALAITGLR